MSTPPTLGVVIRFTIGRPLLFCLHPSGHNFGALELNGHKSCKRDRKKKRGKKVFMNVGPLAEKPLDCNVSYVRTSGYYLVNV